MLAWSQCNSPSIPLSEAISSSSVFRPAYASAGAAAAMAAVRRPLRGADRDRGPERTSAPLAAAAQAIPRLPRARLARVVAARPLPLSLER